MRLSKGLQTIAEAAGRGSDGPSGPLGCVLQQTAASRIYDMARAVLPARSGKVTVTHEGNTTFIEGSWVNKC
jgi:hypothetical protein